MAETGEPAVPGDGAGPGGDEAAGAGSPPAGLAELIAGHLPAGPGLAAWLAEHDPAQVADRDLPGTAAAWRKVASWAQAAELATVAQIAVRSAARDQKAGLEADGRPRQVTRDAAAQAGLGLALSPCGAAAWAGLAVALGWRLARTGAALADGTIDLYRAKVIAEATAPLTDEAARKAEDMVLDRAGDLTYGQLHGAVRRAVIAADPEGAEQRRQAAERRARVTLYPDQDHTATLAGTTLPAVHAAAAMVRISAMARALKAAGAGGGLDYLRAHVFLGLVMRSSYGAYYGDNNGKAGSAGRDGERGRPGSTRTRRAARRRRQAGPARSGIVAGRGHGDLLPDLAYQGPGPDQRGPAGANLPADHQAPRVSRSAAQRVHRPEPVSVAAEPQAPGLGQAPGSGAQR